MSILTLSFYGLNLILITSWFFIPAPKAPSLTSCIRGGSDIFTSLISMNFNHPLVKINRPSGMFIRYNHSVPFPSDDFLQWFVGFSDAEGNFLISIDREFVRFRFKISLHLDDIQVLKLIQSKFPRPL